MYLILGGLIFRGYAPAGATLAAEVFRYMGGLIGILIAIVIIFMIATDQFTQFLLHVRFYPNFGSRPIFFSLFKIFPF